MAVPEEAIQPMLPGLEFEAMPANLSEAWSMARRELEMRAELLGMEPSELEAAIRAKLQRDLQNPISVRRGLRGATSILKEGRFKSQFETGSSGGAFAPEFRAEAERDGLGIPTDVSAEKRPIYGYIRTGEDFVYSYGAVEFELNDDVKERSTLTFGDSLMRFRKGNYPQQLVGTSITNPGIEGWDAEIDTYYKHGAGGISYLEVQMQRGVSLKDISKIIIHSDSPEFESVIKMAREKGIEVIVNATDL